MLEKQIERQAVKLGQYTTLLNEEVENLRRFVSATADKGLSPESKSGLTLSAQVDHFISTISSIGKIVTRYEFEVVKHQEILGELELVRNESGEN